ncbi:MAG TPA: hypothetical protein VNL77_03305 [Roseiflexaceae bacterium]|nr:hypothetical protein [Roseiflexaceae bacterium]
MPAVVNVSSTGGGFLPRFCEAFVTADPPDHPARLRLLECWLPLAQELNESQVWGDDATALEALIVAAAPALVAAVDTASARAILMLYHAVLRRGRP